MSSNVNRVFTRRFGTVGVRRQHRRRGDAGYTLLELLVVMGILAVLTAVATPQLMAYFGKAKVQTAQLQIENIGTALELYYMENGSYPSASVGLKALVEPTSERRAGTGHISRSRKTCLTGGGGRTSTLILHRMGV